MRTKLAPLLSPHALPILILFAGLLATWFAYAPGLGGALQFDDYHNLGGLEKIDDPASAFGFIANGRAGPLGRPLALASFVPQAYAWPDATEVFLKFNILLHLLNGALVAWVLYLVGRVRGQSEQYAALVASGASVIWMLMPLLASSSLFIVQRMTTLSALFTLLGMVGYMYARRAIDEQPRLALAGMTLAIAAGGLLGALAKENGILLFAFILSVEITLLDQPRKVSHLLWRTWFSVVLIAPLVVLSLYLLSFLPYSEDIFLMRGFTGFERLITQAEILWQYLYLTFLPNVPSLGPFHDDYPVQRSLLNASTLLATGAWLAIVCMAVILRRKAPLFSFAVAWYLLGHLIESTTIPLELYFEHRNYLPILGPIFALVALLAKVAKQWRRLAIMGVIVYGGILGGILLSTTSLWGSPALAAEMWHIYKPESLRAVQNLAGRLERQGDPVTSRRLLERFIEKNPDAHVFRVQTLIISCLIEPDENYGLAVETLEATFRVAEFNLSIPAALQQLYELAREDRCTGIDSAAVYQLGESLLANPRFSVPIVQHNVHFIMARIAIDRRDFGLTMLHMEEALRTAYNFNTLFIAIGVLNSGGRSDISWDLLAEAKRRRAPLHPLRALHWEQELERIEGALRAFEQSEAQSQSLVEP